MSIDLKDLQLQLAQQKVYDAWQYVDSLREMLSYMDLSYQLLDKVHENRISKIRLREKEKKKVLSETGSVSIMQSDLDCTNLNIAGININDEIFLRKTTIEFFHYARMSFDILFQIINASLFGDQSMEVTDRQLISKVNNKLDQVPSFANIKKLLDDNKGNDTYKYLQAFDNYIKHIKTILVTVKTSFMLGGNDEFKIKEFVYDGNAYPMVDALVKTKEVNEYIIDLVEQILTELMNQIPNCLDNRQRIQNITFKQYVKKNVESNSVEYISFFIDVQNDLSELPSEIKVYPLIIKPNNEIYSFDFRVGKIFIKKQGTEENGIIGYAELKNGLDTNEFYRIFEIHPCGIEEYYNYIFRFSQDYSTININYYAMEGTIIMEQD